MRITIEQEITKPDRSEVTAAEILALRNEGGEALLIRDAVNAFESANPDVRVMAPTETKVVLRKAPTPIGFSVPTYYLSITTDMFLKADQ